MSGRHSSRRRANSACLSMLLGAILTTPAAAVPSFISGDSRIPNPDEPYVMTGDAVVYGEPSPIIEPVLTLYDLSFQATNPSQFVSPTPTVSGNIEFDSFFDVAFEAKVGFGLGLPFQISGSGTAQVTGIALGGQSGFPPVAEFDTELVSLDLIGPSSILFRESPTLKSNGVTTTVGACYGVCPAVILPIRVSSFFDVFTEVSIDGGNSWTGHADGAAFRVVQIPEPVSIIQAGFGATLVYMAARRRRANAVATSANSAQHFLSLTALVDECRSVN
jgi:hypothetical protein